ncbi:MAG: metallophosphoesterase family protein [Trueperaceae bacterium]
MRLAVISDIHGNLAALEAALADIESLGVDLVVVAGDLVNGAPDSRACWELIRSRGYSMLRGNHERYLFDLGTPAEAAEWQGERFGAVRWAAARFSRAELDEMRDLPDCPRPADCHDLLIVHASPRRDNDNLRPYTPEDEIRAMFAGTSEALVIRGHNHIGNTLQLSGRTNGNARTVERTIVTCGSVGMPLDGNASAQYLLLERHGRSWRWEHRSARYDVDATLRRFHEDGYLEAAGPIGRLLMREIATASHQMVPFLSSWERWSDGGELDLAAAVDSFLNAY